jgi:3-phosphoglycerate kinase
MSTTHIKSLRQVKNLTGKRALLRVDYNVPIEKDSGAAGTARIKDDYKVVAGLPTIRFLLRHKCKVIIITHLGRPLKNQKYFSVKPIADRLSELLGKKVKFVDDCAGLKAGTEVSKMRRGEILMLENLRFSYDEENNDLGFAKKLAKLADIYVNDAFAASHRAHASVSAIKNYLPSYAGLLLENEIVNLNKILRPQSPLIAIIGGAKMETKTPLIKKLLKKSSRILIGGALANNFLAAHKIEVGKSLCDKKSIALAKQFLNKKIILPIDVIVGTKKDGRGEAKVKNVYQVKKNEIILDIGPETIKLYSRFIKKAKTIIWNGPMGMYESEHFKYGTLSIARAVASRSSGAAFGVVGGGETIEALKMTKMLNYVDWVSTGGGAMLAYLSGGKMPGLVGIVK